MSQMDPQQFDRVRAIVTAAQNILEATESDREAVNQLLQKLQRLESKVDQSLAQIPRTIEDSLSKLASATAERAAVQLSEKFIHANQAASDATQVFRAAGNTLWRKYWIATALSQVVFAMILAAAASYFIPSKAEIASRQDQLAELNRSITAVKNGKR